MIESKKEEGKLIISFKGKLDSLNSDEIFRKIEGIIKEDYNILILDCESLEYISSAGLQIILLCAQNSKSKNKQLYIYKPQSYVDEVLKISGFYNFINKIESI